MPKVERSQVARGLSFGAAAYVGWGLAPLFWTTLHPASALEILANRVVWSFVLLVPLVYFQKRIPHVRAVLANRKTLTLLIAASVLIGANWGLFIWATMNGHILDTSLGYFITPLFSTGLGVFFLKEKLRSLQWFAIAIAFSAVVYITWEHHRPPWVGLALSSSFALYGYVKKVAGVDAMESLLVETAALLPLALGYLMWLSHQGTNSFFAHGVSHSLLMASAGVITAVPLMMYGAAVVRVPLVFIGFMQYISSTIQFFLGIWVFHEPMSVARFIGFAITWVALVVLSVDSTRQRRGVATQVVEYD